MQDSRDPFANDYPADHDTGSTPHAELQREMNIADDAEREQVTRRVHMQRSTQDTRRWAFYSLGAQMCGQDTGRVHGPAPETVEQWRERTSREMDAEMARPTYEPPCPGCGYSVDFCDCPRRESPLFTGRALPPLNGPMMTIGRERAAVRAMMAIRDAGGHPLPTHRLPNGLGYIAPETGRVHGPAPAEYHAHAPDDVAPKREHCRAIVTPFLRPAVERHMWGA